MKEEELESKFFQFDNTQQIKEYYNLNPKKFIEDYNNDPYTLNSKKITKVIFVDDNPNFIKLTNNMWQLDDAVKKELSDMNVEVFGKYVYSVTDNLLCICNKIGIIIREDVIDKVGKEVKDFPIATIAILPDGGRGICISKLSVVPSAQKMGLGSLLMSLMIAYIDFTLDGTPPMYLECMGGVTHGAGLGEINTPIQDQMKFFRKFGFRVTKHKKNGDGDCKYARMEFDKTKLYE
jgi:GNAT superfamily N-acetyltransferase